MFHSVPEGRHRTVEESLTLPRLVYDLREPGGNSDAAYLAAAELADHLLVEAETRAAPLLDAFLQSTIQRQCKPLRSRGEYALDLLLIGWAPERYGAAAEGTSDWALMLAEELFWVRRSSYWLKPLADRMRASLVRRFLLPGAGRDAPLIRNRMKSLARISRWMLATGEFEQEALRLNRWEGFLRSLPTPEAERWIEVCTELWRWFEVESAKSLGVWTQSVAAFLTAEFARRGCREDQLFCGQQPAEYHLSLVAAELMNRGLRADFAKTTLKVLLVPACMRGANASRCVARCEGVETDRVCAGCDPTCAVHRLTQQMHAKGVEVYLVPHSTGFSRWLNRWRHEPDVGVIAVACLLNILPGGLEIRAKGIAAQCVPLDFPGCRKHWSRAGITTCVNEERLVQIAMQQG